MQVKYLRKQDPQTSSNTLTQFFIVSRLPKMPTRIQCAFSFFLSVSVDMLSIYFTCIYLLSDTWMVPLTGLLDPAVLVSGTGWGGGEKEDVHGLLPGTHEPIEFPKKYMQIWNVKPPHLESKRKTKPFECIASLISNFNIAFTCCVCIGLKNNIHAYEYHTRYSHRKGTCKMQNRYTYCYKLIIQILQITVEVVDITQPQQLPLKSAHLCNKQVLL